jgi:hypothetical protein
MLENSDRVEFPRGQNFAGFARSDLIFMAGARNWEVRAESPLRTHIKDIVVQSNLEMSLLEGCLSDFSKDSFHPAFGYNERSRKGS